MMAPETCHDCDVALEGGLSEYGKMCPECLRYYDDPNWSMEGEFIDENGDPMDNPRQFEKDLGGLHILSEMLRLMALDNSMSLDRAEIKWKEIADEGYDLERLEETAYRLNHAEREVFVTGDEEAIDVIIDNDSDRVALHTFFGGAFDGNVTHFIFD